MLQCFINGDGVTVSGNWFIFKLKNNARLFTYVYIRFLCKALADKIFWLLSGLSTPGEEQLIGWNSVAFVSVSLKLLNFPVVLETNCFPAVLKFANR